MKKLIAALLCATMVFSISGCGSSDDSNKKDTGGEKTEDKAKDTDKKPLEIVQSGYYVSESYVYYGIVIKNPNKNYLIEYPSIKITMYGEDGSIIGTDDQVLMNIAPGDTLAFGGDVDHHDKVPAKVEFTLAKDDSKYVDGQNAELSSVFKVSNTSEILDGDTTSVTGEIENTGKKDYSTVAVSILFKKGNEIVFGTTGYVDDINKSSKTPFEIRSFDSVPDHDSFDVYVQDWS